MQQTQSSNSVRIISLDRDKLLARLKQIAARIHTEHPEVAEVRVFGSVARGDHTGTSDVDVLIILNDTSEMDPHRRILMFLPYFDLTLGTDLLVFTRAELERRLSANDPSMRRIWDESFIL